MRTPIAATALLLACTLAACSTESEPAPTSTPSTEALTWEIPNNIVVSSPGVTTTVSLADEGLMYETDFAHGQSRSFGPIEVTQANLDHLSGWWTLPAEDESCSVNDIRLEMWDRDGFCLENHQIVVELTRLASDHPDAFPGWYSLAYTPNLNQDQKMIDGPPPPRPLMDQDLRISGPTFIGDGRSRTMTEEQMGRLYWNITELITHEPPAEICSDTDEVEIVIQDFSEVVLDHTFGVCDSTDPSQSAFMDLFATLEEALTDPSIVNPLTWDLPGEGVTIRTANFTSTYVLGDNDVTVTQQAPGRDPLTMTIEDPNQETLDSLSENWKFRTSTGCEAQERTDEPWTDSDCDLGWQVVSNLESLISDHPEARPVAMLVRYHSADGERSMRLTPPSTEPPAMDADQLTDYLWATSVLGSNLDEGLTCEAPLGSIEVTRNVHHHSMTTTFDVCDGDDHLHEATMIIHDIATQIDTEPR